MAAADQPREWSLLWFIAIARVSRQQSLAFARRGRALTEAEWLASDDPYRMVRVALVIHRSKRKPRLYGCACCRRVWHLLRDPRSRKAVEVAEAYVDGKAKLKDAKTGAQAASEKLRNFNAPAYNAS